MLLELAVYMRQMKRLIILDLRANPICSVLGYKDVVINTFPILLSLDAEELNPIDQVKPFVHESDRSIDRRRLEKRCVTAITHLTNKNKMRAT